MLRGKRETGPGEESTSEREKERAKKRGNRTTPGGRALSPTQRLVVSPASVSEPMRVYRF